MQELSTSSAASLWISLPPQAQEFGLKDVFKFPYSEDLTDWLMGLAHRFYSTG